jgi:serine/threonine protein kinase/formylglycine-generating enzyme required for sulfatase activity
MVGEPPPEVFGEYRLIRRLGRGAMGEVHLAIDTLLDRHVALKLLTPPDAKARARFFIEARAAARLQHPNVAAVHRVGELDGRLYIVSELVRGQSLDKVQLPMTWTRVVELGIGLAKGLSAAHRNGVLHRDIKPANAIVTVEGEVKLIDFGLAKLFESPMDPEEPTVETRSIESTWRDGIEPPEDEERSETRTQSVVSFRRGSPTLTRRGVLMGTPFYLAPELWNAEEASVRSDIYALGALLYELLSGRAPHAPGPDEPTGIEALAFRVAMREPPRLSTLVHGIDPGLEEVIERCIARKPEDRFASSEELLEALLKLTPTSITGIALPRGNPYRGLHAFEAEHRALFFGRQSEVRAIVERLRHDSFVLVAGDSGVGKSSLCRAGILPLLPAELHDKRTWSVVEIVPGRRPLAAIESALWPHVESDSLPTATDSLPGGDPRVRLKVGTGLVIFLDQLEELVTLSSPEDASRCARLLFALISGTLGVRILATARSDFLTRLAALPGLGDDITRAIHLLRPMSRASIREAIIGPARATGVRFESDADIERLVKSAMGSEGGLPLLQFALAELWQMRDVQKGVITHADLISIGGVEGALARHADQVLSLLLPAQLAAARKILTKLVTTEGTRSRQAHDALAELDPQAQTALEALVRGRLVVACASEQGTEYEIAHEALINGWRRLRDWLRSRADEHVVLERLARAAGEWERLKDEEVLYSEKQLAEIDRVDPSTLRSRERAFLDASEKRIRGKRAKRWASLAGVSLLIVAIVVGLTARARLETSHRVLERLGMGEQMLERARIGEREVERLRSEAFARFDANESVSAESRWQAAGELTAAATASLAVALRELEAALNIDTTRDDVRARLVEAELLRAETAERDAQPDVLADALARVGEWDTTRRALQAWRAPARLRVDTHPANARVAIGRYAKTRNARWPLQSMGSLGQAPIAELVFEPGSYLLELEAEGFAPVRYPVVLHRGENRALTIKLIEKARVPSGFIYVAAGDFMLGSASEDTLRKTFDEAVPVHPSKTGAFLIAKHETTYGEWIAFLEATGRKQSGGPWPQGLRKSGPTSWDLGFRLNGMVSRARIIDGVPQGSIDWKRIPVERVAESEANAYLAWLASSGRVPHARLCTELEWERAARGADERTYPHGNKLEPKDAVLRTGPSDTGAAYVGAHPRSASPFGVEDMSGNVWELVMSAHAGKQVSRGGAHFNDAIQLAVPFRAVNPSNAVMDGIGLRVCADVR